MDDVTKLYNKIYFTKEFVDDTCSLIPPNVIDFWDLEILEATDGCIRTVDNKIVAIYFYIKSSVQDKSIIKFDYKDEELVFDSIYVRKNLYGESNKYKEFRYDKDAKVIASYDFFIDQPFCSQNKTTTNSKSYSRYDKPQEANELVKEFSKQYLTKEITNHLIRAFYITGNEKEIYWLIQ